MHFTNGELAILEARHQVIEVLQPLYRRQRESSVRGSDKCGDWRQLMPAASRW